MAKSKSRLGKGLAGLISGGANTATTTTKVAKKVAASKPETSANEGGLDSRKMAAAGLPDFQEVLVGNIEPNPYQPRREFDESQLVDLAESIQSEGLIQPIVVRQINGGYQLIAGERRWRAFKLLKLKKIPARIIEAGETSAASMALIENLQREDLSPIEESKGYASLIRDFDLTQEQVAERVGKGRATIANSLRLLSLPDEVQGYLATNMLSTGHAKVLLGLESKQEQALLARRIIEEGVSVRGSEDLVQSIRRAGKIKTGQSRELSEAESAAIDDIERRLMAFLSSNVSLKHNPKKGKIVIEYSGNDDLQRILERIGLEE
jgi:ParB family chromosome partitioning protein